MTFVAVALWLAIALWIFSQMRGPGWSDGAVLIGALFWPVVLVLWLIAWIIDLGGWLLRRLRMLP